MKNNRVIDKFLPCLSLNESISLKLKQQALQSWFPGLDGLEHLVINYCPTETSQIANSTKEERIGYLLDPESCPFIEEPPFEKWACIGFSLASDTPLVLFETSQGAGIYYIAGGGRDSWIRANVTVEAFGDSLIKGAWYERL